MALVAILAVAPTSAAPADIFSIAAPTVGSDPPRATDLKAGDATVSTMTGALTFGYPIPVPPGRGAAVPKLSLSYSSAGPIYGGVAAGWTLSIPAIQIDTSHGILRTRYWLDSVVKTPDQQKADDRFVSSLAGGHRLILVNETRDPGAWGAYRANNDSSFVRYQRMNAGAGFWWRAYTADGMTLEFGGSTANCPGIVSEDYAPLTREIDPFGNIVTYRYSVANGECRIDQIAYGAHVTTPITTDLAQINFTYTAVAPCVLSYEGTDGTIYPGSQVDYRSGTKIVSGASRLTKITSVAIDLTTGNTDHTHEINLGYDPTSEACVENAAAPPAHAPVRLLTSIQQSAWGTDSPRVDLPAETFTYGTPSAVLDTTASQIVPWGGNSTMSWGYRSTAGNADAWPTLEATFIDIDGDGLPDRVLNGPVGIDANGKPTCQMQWRRNLGNMTFGPITTVQLPHLKWAADTTLSGGESCSLNGQSTFYKNLNPSGGHHENTYLAYRWVDLDNDGLVDLVAAIYRDAELYDVDQAGEPQGPLGPWPPCDGSMQTCSVATSGGMYNCRICDGACTFDKQCAAASLAAETPDACALHMMPPAGSTPYLLDTNPYPPGMRTAYSRCNLYPWILYKNLGNGVFSSTPIIKYDPMPLEPETATGALTGTTYVNSDNALTDLDGDGVADLIVRTKTLDPNVPPISWDVWLGDGTGGFESRKYAFITRPFASINTTTPEPFTNPTDLYTSGGLFDINGDGIPDQWENPSAVGADVALNDGGGFSIESGPTTRGTVVLPNTATKLATTTWNNCSPGPTCGPASTGDRWSRDWMVDVDGDGRIDAVNGPLGTSTATPSTFNVYLNYGGNFASYPISFPSTMTSSEHRPRISALGGWQEDRGFIDLDGNGLPEMISFSGTTVTRQYHAITTAPPRLLSTIDNGAGAVTTITYDSMHGASVTQDPTIAHAANPRTGWVVSSISSHDAFSTTTATSSYAYLRPRYLPDDESKWAFRGFDQVTTTAPTGAKTIQRYEYTVDWSGRLTDTVVLPAPSESTTDARSVSKTTWAPRTLFGDTITTYHAILSQHWTCKNGQTEAQCTAPGAAAGYTQTTPTLTALASTTTSDPTPLLWVETESLLQAGTTSADGDRKTVSTFFVDSDAATYRVRPDMTKHEVYTAGNWELFAKSSHTWDATYSVPITDEVWVDTNDTNRAITKRDYDSFGNVTARWKPEQNAAGTTKLAFVYDARHLFVTSEIDEKGLQRDFTYEYGTGVKLTTAGPNVRTCTTNCPNDSLHPLKETHQIRVDGLGRPIEHWETLSNDGSIYVLTQIGTTTYANATPTTAASTTTYRLIENDAPTQTEEKTEVDGHGRPIRKIVFAQGSAPADAVTTFHYRNDGTLSDVTLPDPTKNDASSVSYTYTFDSLGRAKGMRRPDSTTPTNQSGVDVSYDGLVTTSSEFVGSAGGQPAVTTSTKDSFGRVTQIDEQQDAVPSWATTRYVYGPDNNVTQITDADDSITSMTHDFAGRRTQITHGGRTWKYTYDRNGNMRSVLVPGSPNPPMTDGDYTSTMAYDDLDRPASKLNGKRSLSSADQTLFGDDHETYTWDPAGGNRT